MNIREFNEIKSKAKKNNISFSDAYKAKVVYNNDFGFNSVQLVRIIDSIIDIEVKKMINVFGIGKNVMDKFYSYFRTRLYDLQMTELKENFEPHFIND